MNIQIVDNQAYTNYQKSQPAVQHTAKEVAAVDPFDGELTIAEIGICTVSILLVLFALYRAFKS